MNKIKTISEKMTIFAGALAITHGVVNADSTTFCAGLIIETAGITAMQCKQLKTNQMNNNKKILIQTMYHNK